MLRLGTRPLLAAAYSSTTRCWLELSVGGGAPERVEVEVWGKTCPMAAENFARLCKGDMVLPIRPAAEAIQDEDFADQFKPQLHYKGSPVHRVVADYIVQGGDLDAGTGLGQAMSVFGEDFDAPEEVLAHRFDKPGLLGTAVSAPHKNTSQWFVSLDAAPHLDGTCVCFGQVTAGLDLLREVSRLPCDHTGRPAVPVVITDCGP